MPVPTFFRVQASPIGDLLLTSDGTALTRVLMNGAPSKADRPAGWSPDRGSLDTAARQLDEFFEGSRTRFELLLAPAGTPFQRRVWDALRRIPYGETMSYRALAARIGKPRAVRAVGGANGRNPIAIVIPCHRVIGADGRLVGYGGGLDRKRALLELETRTTGGAPVAPRQRTRRNASSPSASRPITTVV